MSVTPWPTGGGNGFALDSGIQKKPSLETICSLAIMATLFPRHSTSATQQSYRALKSCHLNSISPYVVSSFSRTPECWVFWRYQGPSLTHSCRLQSRCHSPTFNTPASFGLGGVQDIRTFLILFQFETCHHASSLKPTPHSISLTIRASRATPLPQGSRL